MPRAWNTKCLDYLDEPARKGSFKDPKGENEGGSKKATGKPISALWLR